MRQDSKKVARYTKYYPSNIARILKKYRTKSSQSQSLKALSNRPVFRK